jgi:DNA-binding MarR family transcriptional regulator
MNQHEKYCKDILISLRKITQAVDLHSKNLKKEFGLTVPQLVVLQEVSQHQKISMSTLAKSVNLSQATITDIVNRLIANGYLTKARSDRDKRRAMISPSKKCFEILEKAPPHLHDTFTRKFANLEHWEQLLLLSVIKRIVSLMAAEKIDADPIL